MTHEKFLHVLWVYESCLEHEEVNGGITKEQEHVLEMIPKMRNFHWDKQVEKAMRWLGFIQGVLYSQGIFTIDEMKNHNKPDNET